MKKRMTKAEKALETAFDDAFRRIGTDRQFNIFDLGKLHALAISKHKEGVPLDDAVKAACDQFEIKAV